MGKTDLNEHKINGAHRTQRRPWRSVKIYGWVEIVSEQGENCLISINTGVVATDGKALTLFSWFYFHLVFCWIIKYDDEGISSAETKWRQPRKTL